MGVAHHVNGKAVVICEVSLSDAMPQRSWTFEPSAHLHVADASVGVHAIATWAEMEVTEGNWMHLGAPSGHEFAPSYNLQGVLLGKQARTSNGIVEVAARFDVRDGALRLGAKWEDGSEF